MISNDHFSSDLYGHTNSHGYIMTEICHSDQLPEKILHNAHVNMLMAFLPVFIQHADL